jgi:hypothetical protein
MSLFNSTHVRIASTLALGLAVAGASSSRAIADVSLLGSIKLSSLDKLRVAAGATPVGRIWLQKDRKSVV